MFDPSAHPNLCRARDKSVVTEVQTVGYAINAHFQTFNGEIAAKNAISLIKLQNKKFPIKLNNGNVHFVII